MGIASKIMRRTKDFAKKHSPSIVKTDEEGYPTRLGALGSALFWGGAVSGAGYSAYNQRRLNDMGTADGRIYTATPDYSFHEAPAAADGSLVFAMDKLKNRGYL